MFYCDAKYSDILRGSGHVCCYQLLYNVSRYNFEKLIGTLIFWTKTVCAYDIPWFNLLKSSTMPFDPVLQYILNESWAWNHRSWAVGKSYSMFWHILLTLVDLLFDNLTIPPPFIHEFGHIIQSVKLFKLLWHASSEFIISCRARDHSFLGLVWISFDVAHVLLFDC